MGKDGRPTAGGYSTTSSSTQDFVLRYSRGVGLDVAAPLLCAGITLYSPLKHWGAGVGKRVASLASAASGHMGVKIAHGLGRRGHGAVPVAFQTGGRQKTRGRQYFATSDEATFKDAQAQPRPHRQHRVGDLPIDSILAAAP